MFRRRKRKELTQSHLEEYLANRPPAPAPRPAVPPTPTPPQRPAPAVPPEYGRPSETFAGTELERQLSICQECGTGLIQLWRAFPAEDVSSGCGHHVPEPSTEAGFRIVAGWTEHELLLRAYHVASNLTLQIAGLKYQSLLDEVERRLGIGPVEFGPSYASPMVPLVQQAIEVFQRECVPWVPLIDEQRLEAEHHGLQYTWGSPALNTGSLAEITDVLRDYLERDFNRGTIDGFRLAVRPAQYCIEVKSHLPGNRAYAYRIWRTPTHYALCRSR